VPSCSIRKNSRWTRVWFQPSGYRFLRRLLRLQSSDHMHQRHEHATQEDVGNVTAASCATASMASATVRGEIERAKANFGIDMKANKMVKWEIRSRAKK